MKNLKRNLQSKKRVRVIAEAGVNHNGDIKKAYKLIDIAKNSGADIVKFQLFKAEKLVTQNAQMAKYQAKNLKLSKSSSQFDMLKKLELKDIDQKRLKNYCQKKKIQFMSTPFDEDSAVFLNKIGISIFKIPSGDITNYLLLKKVASFKKEVFLSTGMANLKDIRNALKILKKFGLKMSNITIMQCNTDYPTSLDDVNLNVINTFKRYFKTYVGYSDHTLDIDLPSYAVAMGATVIEKHFTINRNLKGPDHKASLMPLELKQMIDKIRKVEVSMGSHKKKPTFSEKKNMLIARKSIVASKNIKKGDKFTSSNITCKRPGSGLSPMLIPKLLGKVSKKNYNQDQIIKRYK
jgi:N,N'-diacetyllegionaminate synthase